MEEIWKDIPDYVGLYEASNLGRIRTCAGKVTYTERHGIRHWKQRILKPKLSYDQQKTKTRKDQRVDLWKDGKHKTHLVARLVASAFYGKSDLSVNHIDGNSMNNNIENLEYCSLADNIRKGFETNLYETQIAIKIIDKKTGKIQIFRSMSQASLFLNKCASYISNQLGRGVMEDKNYYFMRLFK